ncbi:MAG: ZIP family metal transporter [Roseivirga sp.]
MAPIAYITITPVLFQSLLLFLSAFLGGLVVLLVCPPGPNTFKFLLLFTGGYLFAITVLHILPDLFALHHSSQLVGLYILIGFFLQLLLELFSGGLEHGHLHDCSSAASSHHLAPLTLLLAMCVHAFFDGVILSDITPAAHHHHHGHSHGAEGLLLGILLHKIPVAFALASVLGKLVAHRSTAIIYLSIFALASPLGLWCSHYCAEQNWLSAHGFVALMAMASGGLLHIATTIFFESSPGHHVNIHKFMASLAGASLAVVLEMAM